MFKQCKEATNAQECKGKELNKIRKSFQDMKSELTKKTQTKMMLEVNKQNKISVESFTNKMDHVENSDMARKWSGGIRSFCKRSMIEEL